MTSWAGPLSVPKVSSVTAWDGNSFQKGAESAEEWAVNGDELLFLTGRSQGQKNEKAGTRVERFHVYFTSRAHADNTELLSRELKIRPQVEKPSFFGRFHWFLWQTPPLC